MPKCLISTFQSISLFTSLPQTNIIYSAARPLPSCLPLTQAFFESVWSWWNTQIKELEDLALGFTRCLALNFLVCKIRELDKDANKFGKLSSGHRTEKVSFHCNSKEGQFQRMLKLLHNCTHFTCQQGHAQNPPSEALTIHELRTYRCTNWI